MIADQQAEPQSTERDPGTMVRVGGWLFARRTSLPIPIAAALVLIPPASPSSTRALWLGLPIVVTGELIRLWGVHHIGVISRTRSDRLGPLVDTGPFALVRNPLYLGNILLWVGFAIAADLAWLTPVIVVLLGFEYHAIVRWEERLLESRIGAPYRDYMARVPRWIPRMKPGAGKETAANQERSQDRSLPAAGSSWSDTFFSERGTLMAIAAGFALLALKASH